MIDIVIPVLNEEKILTENQDYYQSLKTKANIIFVDGGSTDQTGIVAARYGRVLSSAPGRGIQKNAGAAEAHDDTLLFLHVDSFISDSALDRIGQAVKEGSNGGCLTMHIQDKGFIFRIYEQVVNFRAKAFGIIDGDLGMYVRADIFEKLGKFDKITVMEDLVFARKLHKFTPIKVLPSPIYVSSRKCHERGFIRTFWEYTYAYIKLWSGKLKENDIVAEGLKPSATD